MLNGCGKPRRGEWTALKAATSGANAAGNRRRPADQRGVETSADAERFNQKVSCQLVQGAARSIRGFGAIP
jgi:hypothetical protein